MSAGEELAPMIIGLAGRQGSGKSTVGAVLSGRGFDVVSMGDAVRAEARSRGLEVTGENLGRISNELREERGRGAVAELLLEGDGLEGDVVIDGIRGLPEVEVFREGLDHFFLVAVTASREARFERVTGRARSDDVSGREEFLEKEEREDSWGLQGAIDAADLVLENEGSLEELRERVERIPALASRVRVSASVSATETVERVSRGVSTLFPEIELSGDGAVEGTGFGADLEHFRQRLFEQQILDTARESFEEGRRDSSTAVRLDRQSAWVDRVNFDVGGHLGPIRLEVSGRIDDFVDWMAPLTVEGEPVENP